MPPIEPEQPPADQPQLHPQQPQQQSREQDTSSRARDLQPSGPKRSYLSQQRQPSQAYDGGPLPKKRVSTCCSFCKHSKVTHRKCARQPGTCKACCLNWQASAVPNQAPRVCKVHLLDGAQQPRQDRYSSLPPRAPLASSVSLQWPGGGSSDIEPGVGAVPLQQRRQPFQQQGQLQGNRLPPLQPQMLQYVWHVPQRRHQQSQQQQQWQQQQRHGQQGEPLQQLQQQRQEDWNEVEYPPGPQQQEKQQQGNPLASLQQLMMGQSWPAPQLPQQQQQHGDTLATLQLPMSQDGRHVPQLRHQQQHRQQQQRHGQQEIPVEDWNEEEYQEWDQQGRALQQHQQQEGLPWMHSGLGHAPPLPNQPLHGVGGLWGGGPGGFQAYQRIPGLIAENAQYSQPYPSQPESGGPGRFLQQGRPSVSGVISGGPQQQQAQPPALSHGNGPQGHGLPGELAASHHDWGPSGDAWLHLGDDVLEGGRGDQVQLGPRGEVHALEDHGGSVGGELGGLGRQ